MKTLSTFFQNSKTKYIILFGLFIIIWFHNYCFPLIWDDYVYSYVLKDNYFNPMPENMVRISGIQDIIMSQWDHYFRWGGRTIAHLLVQFFLWQGKCFFNIVNALCFVLLLLEIQWIVNKGIISFDFNSKDILWIFCTFWLFSFLLNDVLTWLTLSANYLWTLVLLLGFIISYVRTYFNPEEETKLNNVSWLQFFFGLLAGWTNENTVCFVIIVIGYYICLIKRHKNNYGVKETDVMKLLPGFIGLILGYLLLIFAPGNYVRYVTLAQIGAINTGVPLIKENLKTFLLIYSIRFFLIYYIVRNLLSFRCVYSYLKETEKKQYIISSLFLFIGIGSLTIMIFSPEFRLRSSFASLIFMIISAGMVRMLRNSAFFKNSTENKRGSVNRIVSYIVVIYVGCTLLCSTYAHYLSRQQTDIMMQQILHEKANPSGKVLAVKESSDLIKENLVFWFIITGGHVPNVRTLTDNSSYWINRYISIYYGISGIRAY